MRFKAIALVAPIMSVGLFLYFGCNSGPGNAICTIGYTGCGPHCYDLSTDSNNCGACGKACISTESCISGVCTLPCADGGIGSGGSSSLTPCPVAAPTVCADLQSDPTNCGGCGVICPNGQGCVKGCCQLFCPILTPNLCIGYVDAGTDASSDAGSDASSDGSSDDGSSEGGSGGSSTGSSDDAGTCSGLGPGAFCTNWTTDALNCGACGSACAAGESCADGGCTCSDPLKLCILDGGSEAGTCVDPAWDQSNCGGCGNVCSSAFSCILGRCDCPNGLTACVDAGASTDAGCVNTQDDAYNCGTCGKTCTSAQVCISGTCQTKP
jgi:hypothetical protein